MASPYQFVFSSDVTSIYTHPLPPYRRRVTTRTHGSPVLPPPPSLWRGGWVWVDGRRLGMEGEGRGTISRRRPAPHDAQELHVIATISARVPGANERNGYTDSLSLALTLAQCPDLGAWPSP